MSTLVDKLLTRCPKLQVNSTIECGKLIAVYTGQKKTKGGKSRDTSGTFDDQRIRGANTIQITPTCRRYPGLRILRPFLVPVDMREDIPEGTLAPVTTISASGHIFNCIQRRRTANAVRILYRRTRVERRLLLHSSPC